MNYLVQRFSEPSTYAGLAALLATAGYTIPTPYVHVAMLAGTVCCAVAAVVLKEGWKRAVASGDAVSAVETDISNVAKTTKE
jgi:hypothetical protein